METYVYSWLYQIVANMDGNFNWEQMKQSNTQLQNDVALHDGKGFMVESTRFAEHSRARMADKPPVLIITPLWELKELTQFTEIHMLKPQGCQLINYLQGCQSSGHWNRCLRMLTFILYAWQSS
jgi:hypothetical protein